LGPPSLARSVLVSTSDEPALMRRQAAYLMLAIAEFFRDTNKDVLVLMEAVTLFAMAQREIEPCLLERAGPGTEQDTVSSACWSAATIIMSQWPTPCAASSTATS